MEEENKVINTDNTVVDSAKPSSSKKHLWLIGIAVVLIAVVAYGFMSKNTKNQSPLAIYGEALTKTLKETDVTLKLSGDAYNVNATAKYNLADTLNDTIIDLSQGNEMRGVIANGKIAFSLEGLLGKGALSIQEALTPLGIDYAEVEKSFEKAMKSRYNPNLAELAENLKETAKGQNLKYADKINEKALKQAAELAINCDNELATGANFNKIFKNYSKTDEDNGTTYKFDLDAAALSEIVSKYISANYSKYPELKALLDAMTNEEGVYKTFDEAIKAGEANIAEDYSAPVSFTFTVDKKGFLGKTTIKYEENAISFEFLDVGATKIDKTEIDAFIQECENYKSPLDNHDNTQSKKAGF